MIIWKVVWTKPEGGKTFRKFRGAKPSEAGAKDFARELKRQGLEPQIICANKAWPITQKQEARRRPGMIWCPYCVRWRNFKLFKLKRKTYTSEAFMRCPVCTISTNDYYVKKYNDFVEHMTELDLIKKLMKLEHVSV